jgi:hypothetical protein
VKAKSLQGARNPTEKNRTGQREKDGNTIEQRNKQNKIKDKLV